jgi:hypothetical protein
MNTIRIEIDICNDPSVLAFLVEEIKKLSGWKISLNINTSNKNWWSYKNQTARYFSFELENKSFEWNRLDEDGRGDEQVVNDIETAKVFIDFVKVNGELFTNVVVPPEPEKSINWCLNVPTNPADAFMIPDEVISFTPGPSPYDYASQVSKYWKQQSPPFPVSVSTKTASTFPCEPLNEPSMFPVLKDKLDEILNVDPEYLKKVLAAFKFNGLKSGDLHKEHIDMCNVSSMYPPKETKMEHKKMAAMDYWKSLKEWSNPLSKDMNY